MKFSQRKNHWYFIAITIFIIVVFYFLQSPSRIFFGYITNPLYKSTNKILTIFKSDQTIKDENLQLQTNIKNLVVDYALLKQLEKENSELKKLLNYEQPNYRHQIADIIGLVPGLDKNILLINKGQKSGIQPDMAVVSPAGLLIGKILQSDDFTSQVVLLESSLFKTTAFLQNENNTLGLVEGTRNLGIRMNYLPQTDELKIGDTVITSGRDNLIPRGLVIGQVSAIHKNEGDFFQSVSITSPENMEKIFFIDVLVPAYE